MPARPSLVVIVLRGVELGKLQGVNLFTFYGWGGVSGLVQGDGTRTETYCAYRLMTRGLVGGKERLDRTAGGLGAGTRTMVTLRPH